MSVPRAAVVVTGTEVLGGWVTDVNGPWLAGRLGALGVEHRWTTVVGDRPEDLRAALEHARDRGLELVITSGGLGPTEDDLTAQVVADFAARPATVDPELEARIWAIVEPMSKRWPDVSLDAMRDGCRKQALVPEGAAVLPPVGTAPGLVVPPTDDTPGRPPTPTVVVLPGPPPELQPMWTAAEDHPALRAAVAEARTLHESTVRLFGVPESELTKTMADARGAGVALDAFEITTCMRGGELEVVSRWTPEHDADGRAFEAFLADRHGPALFSPDGSTVDELVLDALRARSWTIGTAESCTGGLLAGRLTRLPGSSDVVEGGIVSYSNAVKARSLGVDEGLLAAHGAVSAEVAAAMAAGARDRLGVDVAVATTGIAGPGGGSAEKPVGLVFVAVESPDGQRTRELRLPGDRARVRELTTTAAMHLVRRLLAGTGVPG